MFYYPIIFIQIYINERENKINKKIRENLKMI
jgi:hypothetical protein